MEAAEGQSIPLAKDGVGAPSPSQFPFFLKFVGLRHQLSSPREGWGRCSGEAGGWQPGPGRQAPRGGLQNRAGARPELCALVLAQHFPSLN